MANEINKITATYIPTRGLNRHFDPTIFGSEFAFTLKNFVIDKGILRTRDGLTKANSGTGDNLLIATQPNGIYLGRFVDSAGVTTECLIVKDGTTLRVDDGDNTFTPVPVPATYGTLESTRGTFFQYGNFVYYTAKPTTTYGGCHVLKVGTDFAVGARKAGCESPDMVKPILNDSCTTWSATSGLTMSVDSNKSHFYAGNVGFKFSYPTENATKACWRAPLLVNDWVTNDYTTNDLALWSDGTVADTSAYLAFTMYRFEKAPITSLKVRLYTDIANDRYYECPVFTTVAAQTPYKLSSAFAQTWADDGKDFHIFDVRLMLDWFEKVNPPVDTPANWKIVSVSFVMTSNVSASVCNSSHPAQITISNVRLQSSPPTCATGKLIAAFESGESWTVDSTGGRDTLYKTEGVHSLRIPCSTTANTNQGNKATWTTGGLDLLTIEEGSGIGIRDWLTVSAAVVNKVATAYFSTDLPKLKIVLTNHAGDTATFTINKGWGYNIVAASSVNFKQVKLSLASIWGAVDYYSGATRKTFADFDWSDIHTVDIYAYGHDNLTFYIDNIRIKRGKYRKYIATFTPGLGDLVATLNDDPVQTFLTGHPVAQGIGLAVGGVADFVNSCFRYKTAGIGSYIMPNYEDAERGNGGLASMKITAGNETVPNILGAASGVGIEGCEGFRVILPFKFGRTIDLTTYGTMFTKLASGSGGSVPVGTDDSDIVRCWMKIVKPEKLLKVKFRLYTGTSTSTDGLIYKLFGDDSSTTAGLGGYWEYVWDASQVHNKAYMEAKMDQQDLATVEKTGSAVYQLNQLLTQSYYTQVTPPTNTPEWVTAALSWFGGDKMSTFLGVEGSADKKKSNNGLVVVAKWKLGDFTYFAGDSATTESKAAITGFGIEVVPVPAETAEVSFDNWYVYKAGNLNGNFWYCTTFVNQDGEESAPSWPSEMFIANGVDINVKNLPATWPVDAAAMNIYRLGGDSLEWRLARTIGRNGTGANDPQQTNVVDSSDYGQLGKVLVDNGFEPPRAEYAIVIGNKTYYANFVDKYGQQRPSSVAISQPHMPGFVKLENYRDLAPNDGSEITGICSYYGQRLVTKTNSIWSLESEDEVPVIRVDFVGNIAPRSLAVTSKYVIFLGKDGFYIYDGHTASDEVGLPVRSIFADIIGKTYTTLNKTGSELLADGLGFVFGDYYWFFYPDLALDASAIVNTSCVGLHIPSGWWCQAEFNVASSTLADVSAVFVDKGKNRAYVGTNNTSNKWVMKFLSGTTDNEQVIVGTWESGHLTHGAPTNEKIVKSIYIRMRALEPTTANDTSADCSFALYPTVEEIRAEHEDVAHPHTYTHTDSYAYASGDRTGNITNKYKTFHFSNPAAANGFIHQLSLICTGRVEVSGLYEMLDVLPPRNV